MKQGNETFGTKPTPKTIELLKSHPQPGTLATTEEPQDAFSSRYVMLQSFGDD